MKRFSAALGAILLLGGCGAPVESVADTVAEPHIVGGTVDDGHPAVVMIYYNEGGGSAIGCTGTVIAPTVVLTAGHCTVTDETCVQPACTSFTPANYTVSGGTTPFTSPAWTAMVAEVHTNPAYNGGNIADGGDSGILILATAAPVTPVPWLAVAEGQYGGGTGFTEVGYGLTSINGDNFGTKRSVQLSITQDFQNAFGYGTDSAGGCNGDSGGPALEVLGTSETVVATVTGGTSTTACGPGVDTETAALAASFIGQFVPGVTGTDEGHGGCKCEVGAGNSPGISSLLLGAVALLCHRRREA